MRIPLLLALSLWSMATIAADSRLTWMTDYSTARKEAASAHKPLLIFFTSSDWSGWGMKMKKEILDAPPFAEATSNQFLFVLVDFPHYKTLPQEVLKQNEELKEKFEITEFPRLVLLSEQGQEIARFGYCDETGEKLASDLQQIIVNDKKLTQVMLEVTTRSFTPTELENYYKLAEELKRSEEANLLLNLGLKSSDPLFFLLEKYRLLVEEGKRDDHEATSIRDKLLRLDPNNVMKVEFSLALIDFQALASSDVSHADLKKVISPLEDYLRDFGANDAENIWRVEMMIAQFYLDYDRTDEALKHAEAAFKAAPVSMKEEIAHSLEVIREEAAKEIASS